MNYEKKYKEALERAREWYNDSHITIGLKGNLKDIFPELAESEDERIRKALIDYFDDANKSDENPLQSYGIQTDEVIAWLNKQGEQKPVDKVEPKFKVGDWVVRKYTKDIITINQVVDFKRIDDEHFGYTLDDETYFSGSWESFYRLWTIQDAKDGDVLVTVDDEYPFIYKGCLDPKHPDSPVAYCGINDGGDFWSGNNKFNHWWTNKKVQPATKEQRDALFKAIAESRYIFDFDKKELKKIEQKPIDKVEPKFLNGQWVVWLNKCYKVNDNGSGYELIDQNGLSTSLEYGTVDTYAHLWDVTKDAKDGDVLVASDNSIFIFSHCRDNVCVHHIALEVEDKTIVVNNDKLEHGWETIPGVCPATKEQRDFLFQKMKEAGYEWDANKKELKKIEQNPAWSEEDMSKVQRICKYLNESKKYYADITEVRECMDWLKSLKERLQK